MSQLEADDLLRYLAAVEPVVFIKVLDGNAIDSAAISPGRTGADFPRLENSYRTLVAASQQLPGNATCSDA